MSHQSDIPVFAGQRRQNSTADTLGIHPLNALLFVGVDALLFGGEMASGFLLTVLSFFVSFALMLPSMLIQRFAFKDGWMLSFAKAASLSLLTAIPTAAPAVITGALGVTGAVALRSRPKNTNVIDIRS